MADRTPKYALINGRECALVELIPHYSSGETACIFEDEFGIRRFASGPEWNAAAEEFARYAAKRHLVTTESPGRDKIALFKSLFKGRGDVYAHGFARKGGGIGYSPACSNERTKDCPHWTRANRGIKCADCAARRFVPVNDRALIEHFKGKRDDCRDVMGMYVLLADCTTWVLVADFDKEGWQRETALYRNACRSFGLHPAVERSRSGNGAHVWLFFEEPVDAELARNLGCALITYAMSQASGMSFEAYDRLFPTQSTIPEGGFGNLIALPFQGQAQRQLNSVFVDDDFIAFPDQWRFLSAISKVSTRLAQEIASSAIDGPLGRLAFTRHMVHRRADSEGLLPAAFSGQIEGSTSQDFPKSISVVKANMLYVDKQGVSQKAQNQIRRLAAFGNPEFYRAQAMHQSVYGKSRIVWCGEEDERNIMLPRGCEQKLVRLVSGHGCVCSFDDCRNKGERLKVEFKGELRGRQQKAADVLLHHENGVLSAPTGFGKTIVGAYLIGKLKVSTLIIVPKTSLVEQWKTRLAQFLSIEDDRPPLLTKSGKLSKRRRPVIGQLGGGKNAPSGIIDIATFQSLSIKDDLGIPRAKPVVADYDLVICDECHYGAAPNLELIMKSVNARWVYGLSATPKRSDGLEGIIYMQCGPIRHKVDPKEQAAEQGFRRVLLPRFTRIRLTGLEQGASFNQVVDRLCDHGARNVLIVEDALNAVKSGRAPLVITKLKRHAADLSKLLQEAGVETVLLTGEGTAREKRERIERARSTTGVRHAIVATGSYIGEGFDLPQLDTLLLASPYSWEGIITQYSGRLHRENEGKDNVIVFDYVDTSVPMLERMYKKRLKTYAKLGYEIGEASEEEGPGARIIAVDTWRAELSLDFSNVCSSAIVSAPYANSKLVESLLPDIVGAVARGVAVRVILGKPKDEKSATIQSDTAGALSNAGCKVVVCDSPLTGIAVFDDKIAWYGTLPLLAFAKSDDCSIRVDGAEVASDLKEALEASL